MAKVIYRVEGGCAICLECLSVCPAGAITIEADTPVGDRVGKYYDTEDVIYNLLTFSDSALTIRSFTLDGGEVFNEFPLQKTSAAGGHVYRTAQWYNPLIRLIGTVYAVFNNMGKYSDYKELGLDVKFFDIVFGGGNG